MHSKFLIEKVYMITHKIILMVFNVLEFKITMEVSLLYYHPGKEWISIIQYLFSLLNPPSPKRNIMERYISGRSRSRFFGGHGKRGISV